MSRCRQNLETRLFKRIKQAWKGKRSLSLTKKKFSRTLTRMRIFLSLAIRALICWLKWNRRCRRTSDPKVFFRKTIEDSRIRRKNPCSKYLLSMQTGRRSICHRQHSQCSSRSSRRERLYKVPCEKLQNLFALIVSHALQTHFDSDQWAEIQLEEAQSHVSATIKIGASCNSTVPPRKNFWAREMTSF